MSTSALEKPTLPDPEVPPADSGYRLTMLDAENSYAVDRKSFYYSYAINMFTVLLVIWASHWTFTHKEVLQKQVSTLATDIGEYLPMPVGNKAMGGGGGGGDRDKLAAPKGAVPKIKTDIQITPPAVVVRNENPKLAVEPSVVAPPNIPVLKTGDLGDPLAKIMGAPSNGTGAGGGIGSGSGGGVGSGRGPGVGPGWGGGYGGGVYRVGNGVSAPVAVYDPEPDYSEEARKAKYQGVVVLAVVVGPDGRAHDPRVQRSLGMGLDEKAIEKIKEWKFEPAKKDGVPVAVMVSIEVSFHLY
ncbi:TonB-like protein [Candidatus Koribacter versatilis Ellin345]|uniref:TonB-like protein n=1 Tax=Koribacter versatilis (strain Ellin345) TaxID=204669 RepID=Q1IM14_KORVE|nr:energy transducer TonB [Candidatus Koribacter versatilis]ABF42086.1 TonB-like protein [Candidatus Koribacter versatilis Ellin345]